MSIEKSILKDGYGTPFVIIADPNNKPIIEPNVNKPVGELVTNFSYEYDEEDDDTCKIVITCDNPDLVDIPQFRVQQYILVQWGILFSDGLATSSQVRKIMIRDSQLSGSYDNNIQVTLDCTDGFSIMKTAAITQMGEKGLLGWIDDNLSGKYKFKYWIEDVKEVKAVKNNKPYYIGIGIATGALSYNNQKNDKIGLVETDADTLIKQRMIMQIGKTPYTALKDNIKSIPNGPYYLDTRDDEVNVKPVNFNQPSIATYSWKQEPGEILGFEIATRKKAKALDVVSDQKIDGDTKSMDGTVTQTDGNTKNLDVDGITGATISEEKLADTETTKRNLAKDKDLLMQHASNYLKETVDKYKNANGDPVALSQIGLEPVVVKVKAKVKDEIDPASQGDYWVGHTGMSGANKEQAQRRKGWEKLKRDNNLISVTPVPTLPNKSNQLNSWTDHAIVVQEKEFDIELQPADLLGFAGESDVANQIALNNINEALQKQLECDLKLVGQPFLESGKIITINNISKTYSGDWYIKNVEHRINSSTGYLCDLNLIKKTASNGNIIQSSIKTSTTSLASKVQDIAKAQLDPTTAARNEAIISEQKKFLNEFKDKGEVVIGVNEEGEVIAVKADSDWVSREKLTKTDQINTTDKEVKEKLKSK